MRKPRLSFVMPCYNAQVYLAEAIQSILNQKMKDLELVIVNDCSTDSSRDIIDFYQKRDSRVRCVALPVNGGMSNARNVGNKEAKADIIAVQDADDMSFPERAGYIVRFFEKNRKESMFYSAFTVIDEIGHATDGYAAEAFDIENVYKFGITCIGHPTMSYRKKVILEHPYQNGEWSRLGCEDFRLITELWKSGLRFGYVNKNIVLYRWHSKNSSQTRDTKRVNEIKAEYIRTYLMCADLEGSGIRARGSRV